MNANQAVTCADMSGSHFVAMDLQKLDVEGDPFFEMLPTTIIHNSPAISRAAAAEKMEVVCSQSVFPW